MVPLSDTDIAGDASGAELTSGGIEEFAEGTLAGGLSRAPECWVENILIAAIPSAALIAHSDI